MRVCAGSIDYTLRVMYYFFVLHSLATDRARALSVSRTQTYVHISLGPYSQEGLGTGRGGGVGCCDRVGGAEAKMTSIEKEPEEGGCKYTRTMLTFWSFISREWLVPFG